MIEHNLDVLLQADHLIDLGPEGGDKGGEVVVTGTPEKVAGHTRSYTGIYIKEMLDRNRSGRRAARNTGASRQAGSSRQT
jgi:excinuclease ABC subunit A